MLNISISCGTTTQSSMHQPYALDGPGKDRPCVLSQERATFICAHLQHLLNTQHKAHLIPSVFGRSHAVAVVRWVYVLLVWHNQRCDAARGHLLHLLPHTGAASGDPAVREGGQGVSVGRLDGRGRSDISHTATDTDNQRRTCTPDPPFQLNCSGGTGTSSA